MASEELPEYVDNKSLEENWDRDSIVIMEKKYLPCDKEGNILQRPAERFYNVAKDLAEVEGRYDASSEDIQKWTKNFYQIMSKMEFLPGGRILSNVGTDIKALSNCYVLPVPDDLHEIFMRVQEAAVVHKNGGGTGYNFSELRPRGAKVKNGIASGPVSFASQFDKETEVINSGNRRGANMGILNVDHPDVFEFIRAKYGEGKLSNFNLSIGVTDEFMECYRQGKTFPLRYKDDYLYKSTLENMRNNILTSKAGAAVGKKPVPPSLKIEEGKVYNVYPLTDEHNDLQYDKEGEVICEKTEVGEVDDEGRVSIDPKNTLEMVASLAHLNGEPGIVFLDSLERDNKLTQKGKIKATNPCGEQPLHDYDACDLGSINLAKMVSDEGSTPSERINYDKLSDVTRKALRLLDNVIDLNKGPIDKIEQTMLNHRRVGLGVMGWADMLAQLRVPYNSEEARNLAKEVMGHINKIAKEESVNLASEKGPFPDFENSDYDQNDPNEKVRNLARTTIAPTGSISMLAGANSGIEPYFGLCYSKSMRGGDRVDLLNPHFKKAIKEEGLNVEEILEKVKQSGGSCQNVDDVPDHIKKMFKVAGDISPEDHIKMQAAFQEHVDNAISKTINLPYEATVKDVLDSYKNAYELGCKGLTVYRNGSRQDQVLSAGTSEEVVEIPYDKYDPRPRPSLMHGSVYTIRSGCGKLFVTISHDEEGRIVDIFANPNNEGGCTANLNALTVTASKALRAGMKINDLIDGFKAHTCPSFMRKKERDKNNNGSSIKGASCPSAIGFILQDEIERLKKQFPETYYYMEEDAQDEPKLSNGSKCPECGGILMEQEGCVKCTCGYSKC